MVTQANTSNTISPWAVGFASFAGILMVLGGVFQAIQGLVAVFNQNLFVAGESYIFKINVTTWGWVHLILGSVLALAGLSIFSGQTWGRAIGIILALLSAVANFFYIPYYPLWSILIIAVDMAIIWALTTFNVEEAM